jgi:diguanylate cyclase (GGDEF)-like protein/PAS domain S-box-containing protein
VTPDTSGWTPIGRSGNADVFEVEPGVLAVVPFDGASDTAETAAESIEIQLAHLRARGRSAGTIIFMDRIASQSAGARDVYHSAPDPAFQTCFALVGQTMFGRAASLVFIDLNPPRVPTRVFGTLQEALTWVRQTAEARSLPAALVKGFFRLCQGEFDYRLPRTMSRDRDDTTAFFFNTIADELERVLRRSREREDRLALTVAHLSDTLVRVAAGDFTAQVNRDYGGDPADVLAFLVNNTISELGAFVAANERRAEEDRVRLERLVLQRAGELQQSEENFRMLLAIAPVPMLLIGLEDERVRFVNERAAALFEMTVEEMVGAQAPELHPEPEVRRRFRETLERERRIDAAGVEIRTRHGASFHSLLNASTLVSGGETLVMLTLTDVTEQKRIEDQLRALATTDALTGALTRRHFFDLAALEWARSSRHRHPLCVALIDVDHFKMVNDTFGHGIGDEALSLVSETVRSKLRRHDLLGRYGGDELALLFPETPLEGAQQVSDRIRRAVGEIELLHGDKPVRLTISAGLVERRLDETLTSACQRADKALYEAKGAGRDCVIGTA